MNGNHFRGRQGPLLAAVLFGVIGFVILLQGLLTLYHAHSSTQWPSCSGEITRSQHLSERDRHNGEWHSRPIIEYSYGVAEETYDSSRIAYRSDKIHGVYANSQVNAYPSGAVVTVYYDPEKPARSVIETGVYPQSYAALAASGCLLLIAALCLLIARFKRAELPTANPSSPIA